MEPLLQKVAEYGYAGLFSLLVLGIVGLPVPDETLLVFCGYLISQRKLDAVLTWLAGTGGSMCGISLSYMIGRTAGIGFVHRYGRYVRVTDQHLDRVHRWFDRIGHWLLTIGYFIPGVRHFTALVAGMSGMPFSTFAAYAYPGAMIWVTTFLTIGYVLGENWRQAFETVHRNVTAVTIVALAAGLLVWWWKSRRRSR